MANLQIAVRIDVDVYTTFLDDAGSVYPLNVADFCELVNKNVALAEEDVTAVRVCELLERNGRVILQFQLYDQTRELYVFYHNNVSEIRADLPEAAVRWLDRVNQAVLKYPNPGGKPCSPAV